MSAVTADRALAGDDPAGGGSASSVHLCVIFTSLGVLAGDIITCLGNLNGDHWIHGRYSPLLP